jgi:hypothetical protein
MAVSPQEEPKSYKDGGGNPSKVSRFTEVRRGCYSLKPEVSQVNEQAPGISRSSAVWAVSVLLLLITIPDSSGAQVVRGQLLDAQTGEPVSNATVALQDDLGSLVASTETDSVGAYSLTAPGSGRYSLRAEAWGYETTPTLPFEVSAEGPTIIDVHLHPEPIGLDSLAVEAEPKRIIPHLERQGFYERAEEGFGEFITPEEIERRNPRSFSDLLRDIPGLSVRGGGELRWGPRCRRMTPRLWIDGILVDEEVGGLRRIFLDRKVSIDEIAAVEVYQSAAAIPLQYGGTGGHCAMFIWTKGGFSR